KRSLGAGEWIRRGLGVAVLVAVVAVALGLDTGFLTQVSSASRAALEQGLIDRLRPSTKPTGAMQPSVVAKDEAGGAMMMKPKPPGGSMQSSVIANDDAGGAMMMKPKPPGGSMQSSVVSDDGPAMMKAKPDADAPAVNPGADDGFPSLSGAVEW